MRSTPPAASAPAEPAIRGPGAAPPPRLLRPLPILLALYVLSRGIGLAAMLIGKHGNLGATLGNAASHTYDAAWYDLIAQHGYADPHLGSPITVFYPGYPLGVAALFWPFKAIAALFIHGMALEAFATTVLVPASTLIVCNVALLLALRVLWLLYAPRLGERATLLGLVLLLVAPTSFFFSSGYSESLFVVLVAGAFLAAERGRWFAAGLLGACACLARFPGVFLIIPLGLLWLNQAKPRSYRAALPALAIFAVGAAAFPAWLAVQSGGPGEYLRLQALHGRQLASPLVAISDLFRQTAEAARTLAGRDTTMRLREVPTVLANVAALCTGLLGSAIGTSTVPPYQLAWVLLVLIVPLATGTAESLDRYWLSAFPLVFIFGRWLSRRPVAAGALIVASLGGLAVLAYNFARVVFVG